MLKIHVTGSWYSREENAALIKNLGEKGYEVLCDWTHPDHTEKKNKTEQFHAISEAINAADVCFFNLAGMTVDGVERDTASTYIQFGQALGGHKPCIVYDPLMKTRETKDHYPPAFTNLMGHALTDLPGTVLWTDSLPNAIDEIPNVKWLVPAAPEAPPSPRIHVTGSWFAQPENATLIEHFTNNKYHVLCDWTAKAHQDKPKSEQLLAILHAIDNADACFFSLDGMFKEKGGPERTTAATFIQFGVTLGAKKKTVVFDPLKDTRDSGRPGRPGCPPAFNNISGQALYDLPGQILWTADMAKAEEGLAAMVA